jgi:hydrogenase nickel incorporation protein HypB
MGSIGIKVYRNIMGANDEWAAKVRAFLREKSIGMVNIIGSPGCGKTSLLEFMAKKIPFAVLEGDLETTNDAARLQVLGVNAVQLLTGSGCHLEARTVYQALAEMDLERLRLVVVENVGNLVCPAEFDLGEDAKIAVLSVTEGEDKPVKYPLLFREARACVLTKIDLLPHLRFKLDACLDYISQVNAGLPVFQVSTFTGQGMEALETWLGKQVAGKYLP